MPFVPGDLVLVAGLGAGTVREVRNGERYLVDVKGRALVATGDQLTRHEAKKSRVKPAAATRAPEEYEGAETPIASLDLHGQTVDEATDAVGRFLNASLLAGHRKVSIIHGRSGGRLKSALHAQLKTMPSIRAFRVDPRNPGATIVEL